METCESFGMEIWESFANDSCSQSLGYGDSNALIMPYKRIKKRKGMNQEHVKVGPNKKQKLAKPHIKKLKKLEEKEKKKFKKLEEKKEKKLQMEKITETLKEYVLPDFAHRLLLPSMSINRAKTRLEKRKRDVHLLEQKLDFPHGDDEMPKKLDLSHIVEPEEEESHIVQEVEENDNIHQIRMDPKVFYTISVASISSQEPVAKPPADISSEMQPDQIRSPSPMYCSSDEIKSTKSKDTTDENPNANFNKLSNLPGHSSLRPSVTPTVVHVHRPTEVEDKRKDLPIVTMEQEIMEAINDHSSVIICGATGCGKTTQVPQFLYEAGYGSSKSDNHNGIIGVTQPRRVAVLATAKRVAYELGLHLGKEVGFQVRYNRKIGNSSIKFMTDGILLQEVKNDIYLKRYSVIILDEAHERSLNTDILIGMLSRVVETRQKRYNEQQKLILSGESISPERMVFPLKLVLMSATLRVQDFTCGRLFNAPPPVIEVPTRQFPVTVYFSKRTEKIDYIGEAYKKVLAIHKRLPPGGILVFVTGQREVKDLCRKLRKASREFMTKKVKGSEKSDDTVVPEMCSVEGTNINEINELFEIPGDEYEEDVDGNESDFSYDSEADIELGFSDDDNLEHSEDRSNIVNVLRQEESLASLKAAFENLSGQAPLSSSNGEQTSSVNTRDHLDQSKVSWEKGPRECCGPSPGELLVLPLYAMLPAAAQLRVFEGVEEGKRLVVVATNVAETSLTIPGIKYVVDTGREKVKNYDSSNGMETYEVQWISKASADQRAGRAGRTGPGHCYRLYSSAVFIDKFPEYSPAEVDKVPIHGVVLLLKSMDLKSIGIEKVADFPFPTSLKAASVLEAENCLKALEALDDRGELTTLGKAMADYPMSPRHSRMLLTVIKNTRHMHQCNPNLLLAYAVAAAAALSLSNPFTMQYEGNDSGADSEMHGKCFMGAYEKDTDKREKLRRKKLKEISKVAREKFRVVTSDALTIAYALQCFDREKMSVKEIFCDDNALHFKTMEEMSKLRRQLLELVFKQSSKVGLEEEYSWIHGTLKDVEHAWKAPSENYPLSWVEERFICQAICAGWADRVAKRVTTSSRASGGEKMTHAVRYQSCNVGEDVFLHRWSFVSTVAPEFLVYNELLKTKRPDIEGITSASRAYMHGVTSVEPAWLVVHAKSSCSISHSLPFYDAATDQVKRWVMPTFGRFNWKLPKCSLPISNEDDRIRAFAYVLLDGQVCPCLKSVRNCMSAPPADIILKEKAIPQTRVENLVSKLKHKKIDNAAKLSSVWEKNRMELYSEISAWFQKRFYKHFEDLWLPMVSECLKHTR